MSSSCAISSGLVKVCYWPVYYNLAFYLWLTLLGFTVRFILIRGYLKHDGELFYPPGTKRLGLFTVSNLVGYQTVSPIPLPTLVVVVTGVVLSSHSKQSSLADNTVLYVKRDLVSQNYYRTSGAPRGYFRVAPLA